MMGPCEQVGYSDLKGWVGVRKFVTIAIAILQRFQAGSGVRTVTSTAVTEQSVSVSSRGPGAPFHCVCESWFASRILQWRSLVINEGGGSPESMLGHT